LANVRRVTNKDHYVLIVCNKNKFLETDDNRSLLKVHMRYEMAGFSMALPFFSGMPEGNDLIS